MKPYIQAIACVSIAILASCASPPPESSRVPVSTSSGTDQSLASCLFRDVNAYRRSQGCQDLQCHGGLDQLAQRHSEYLLKNRGSFSLNGKNVSHFGSEGRFLAAREQFHMSSVSENVVASTSAQSLVGLWKASKAHHQNMLDDWTHSGIGVVVDKDGMIFATQLFSTCNSSHRSTQARFNNF